jgi:hypothetical protein
MKKLVENSPAMRRVDQTIACMESILEMRMESNSGLPADNTRGIGSRFDVLSHPDGLLRKIPPDWD